MTTVNMHGTSLFTRRKWTGREVNKNNSYKIKKTNLLRHVAKTSMQRGNLPTHVDYWMIRKSSFFRLLLLPLDVQVVPSGFHDKFDVLANQNDVYKLSQPIIMK